MAKILIVDDSNFMVSIIKNFAKKSGRDLVILVAHNGEEAIEVFDAELPDLVFMDIKMEGMDGLAALEHIRERHPMAKVVMCTSVKEDVLVERANAAGAVGYIMKPFTSEEIIGIIDTHL